VCRHRAEDGGDLLAEQRQALHQPLHLAREQLSGPPRAVFEAAAGSRGRERAPGPNLPPFVGRTAELAVLERHFAGLGSPVLLVAGEPGIGKSRPLQEGMARVAGPGLRVLQGGCGRADGQGPYAPLLDALQRHLRQQAPAQLRRQLDGCAWLVRLLPELAYVTLAPIPSGTLPPEQERRLMFAAVARLLAQAAGPVGTALVLDDLQWAGADALDLLSLLAREARDARLRIVGAYRSTEVNSTAPLAALLAECAQAGLATQQTLRPLAAAEAHRLLAAVLPAAESEAHEQVVMRSGGVPFFLVSLAQGLRQDTAAGAVRQVPWDVEHSVRQRVAALPAGARTVLGAAAVAGRVVTPAVLMAAMAQPEEEVLAALESACHRGLLRDLGTEGYQFAHDVIREVVEADLGTARRAILHRRIAAALEIMPGDLPVDQLAYHYSHSGPPDKAVLYLERAGDQAHARAAWAAAQRAYQDLATRLDALGRSSDAARAREKLGAVLRAGGHFSAALEVLQQVATTYRAAGDLARWGTVSAQIGEIHQAQGTVAAALQELQPVLVALEEQEAWSGVAALGVIVAHLLGQAGHADEQLVLARRAVDVARRLGDGRLLAYALRRSGYPLYLAGQPAAALAALEETLQLAEEWGDLPTLSWTLSFAGEIYGDQGEVDRQRRYVERGLGYAERLDDPHLIMNSALAQGALAFHGGDWGAARHAYQRSLAASRRLGPSRYPAWPLGLLAQLALAEGARQDAEAYLAESTRIAEGSGGLWTLPWVQSVAAYADLLAGRLESARARLAPLLAGPDLAARVGFGSMPVRVLLAWAHLELGAVAAAAALAATATRDARSVRSQPALADALWMEAKVALRQQRWREADDAVEEGLAIARRLRQPYREARLLRAAGELHHQQGETGPARDRWEAALACFCRLGAHPESAAVAQALAALQED
jgi:tetratricopeptide (TPR) repeat protein